MLHQIAPLILKTKKMRILIFILIFILSYESVYSQLSISTDCDAYTNVDFPDGDGTASDACSNADCSVDPLIEATLVLSQYSCDFSLPDGFPGAYLIYDLNINHTSYPVQNFLTHEVPYGFQYTLETESATSDIEANYEFSQNSNMQSGNLSYIGSSNYSIDLDNDHIMTLPKSSYGVYLFIEAYVASSDDTDFEINNQNQIKLMVPSQFYLDNGLISPTSVNINASASGSRTFSVEERCAEDIYLEAGVDVGSYTY